MIYVFMIGLIFEVGELFSGVFMVSFGFIIAKVALSTLFSMFKLPDSFGSKRPNSAFFNYKISLWFFYYRAFEDLSRFFFFPSTNSCF